MSQEHNICLIDDDEVYKFFMQKMLKIKKLAGAISSFPDGDEAFKFINENKKNPENLPDLIFLDINMPIMNGFQFMDEYTKISGEIDKKITIYMITSSIDPVDLAHSKKFPEITDFITKPVTMDVLEKITSSL